MRVNRMTIPDKGFRNYLKNKFNLKWYSKFDPLEITTLKIRGTRIKSLKGIEYFSNLKELDCIATGITRLNLSQNHKLETLACECCEKLAALDLSNNIELQKLNLGDTGLHDLNLNNNIHLESIRINRTFIKEIHVAHLSKLKEFDCMGSSMKALNLSNNKLLEHLECFFCDELTSIDVSGCTKLKSVIGYSSPNLTHLHLGTHPNLEELYLKNTNINELDTSVCPRLKVAEYNQSMKVVDKEYTEYYTQAFIDVSKHLYNIGGAHASGGWANGYDRAVDNMYDEIDNFSYDNSKINYEQYQEIMENYGIEGQEDISEMNLNSKIKISSYREGIEDILNLLNNQNVTISFDEETEEFKKGYYDVLSETKDTLTNILHNQDLENDFSIQKEMKTSYGLEM